jgi:ubiquinone/menaquinone biosynthesis C-methylase UbiE
MREGPGVDRVLDLHALDLPDGTAGTVVCVDTLEHVEHPRTAVEEMHRILAPGGLLILSSVFDFPIHGYPNDFWRFTPEGFRSLLVPFAASLVSSYGRSDVSPQNVIGVGFKDKGQIPTEFERAITQWSNWYSGICRQLSQLND